MGAPVNSSLKYPYSEQVLKAKVMFKEKSLPFSAAS
jgi:hypothetical protein